jgi:flagellar hook protein FlgE
MSSSLLAGVSGLRVHQQLLDVTGNNLANVNTIGFKSSRLRFSDLLSQTAQEASGATETVGGRNPIQVGLGVKVAALDAEMSQGTLEPTGNVLDMAVQGDGYFVLSDGAQRFYTRAGAFAVDENNYLVDPATGYKVQRFGDAGEGSAVEPAFQAVTSSDIVIPYNHSVAAQMTSEIGFTGNLSSGASGPVAELWTMGAALTDGGAAATAATLLNDLDSNTVDYVNGDTIEITGTDTDGSAVSATLTLAAAATATVGDLINAMSAAYGDATATIDATGRISLTADTEGAAALSVTLADGAASAGATTWSNHTLQLATNGADGDTVTTAIDVYDEQGNAHTLTMIFQKMATNTWNITASVPAGEGTVVDGSVTGVTFNDDGSFSLVSGTGAGDANLTVNWAGLTNNQTVALNFGTSGQFDKLTQFGGSTSAAATEQDGFEPGFLSSLSIGSDGTIEGVFTNGQVFPIAQLQVASFSNPAGLRRVGDNYYTVSSNSGEAVPGTGLTGGRGLVQSGVLELSNVDIALEVVRLITAQRGFQVNARTITTTDEIMQELSNLVR